MPVLRDILAGAALLAALAPARAWAGNVGLPRTPVQHKGEVCMTRVDRSVDPVVHLEYTIPFVDVCLTPDEPADSRTHQFVAFCRDAPPSTLPNWMTWADVQANLDSGYLDPDEVAPEHVLEDIPYFDGCWRPITSAEQRRPITCEAARPGVDWDTSSLAPGPHVVAGYTYEPTLNQWTPRRGVFRVHDGDPDAAPPAAAIFTREADVWNGQPVRLTACVDAPPGSTWRLEFAVAPIEPALELEWMPLLPVAPVESGDLDLEFVVAPEYAGVRLTLRLVVEDPQARTAVAHMPAPGIVLMREETGMSSSAGDDGGDAFDFCRDNPHADDPPKCATGSETGSTDEPATDDPEGGCACRSTPHSRLAPLWLLLPLTRRRRTARLAPPRRSSPARKSR